MPVSGGSNSHYLKVYTNKEDAVVVFNNLVKHYYIQEINMAKDLFNKEINSLEDILKESKIISDNCYLNGEFLESDFSKIFFLDFQYGIETNDNFMKCTIYREKEEELEYGEQERTTEEVYIILEKIETNLVNSSNECLLDNYKDLENYIKHN